MDYFAQRRERLSRLIESAAVDSFLIANPINVNYLTGFSGDSSYLILGKARAILVSDARFTEQIGEECPGLDTFIRPPSQTLAYLPTQPCPPPLGGRPVHNEDRPHRTLGLQTPELRSRPMTGPIRSRPVLNGPHHAYERAA